MYHLSIGTPMMISSMAIFESYEDALRDQTEAADVRRNDAGGRNRPRARTASAMGGTHANLVTHANLMRR